ncbi:MAG: hypothetical protein NT144_09235 [Bacteroidia bacterium]|nr:hypothetical protein [Bacteroidia bacterium]
MKASGLFQVLDNARLPESFDLNKMINIRWKVAVPELLELLMA